jgi:hypothetical protein
MNWLQQTCRVVRPEDKEKAAIAGGLMVRPSLGGNWTRCYCATTARNHALMIVNSCRKTQQATLKTKNAPEGALSCSALAIYRSPVICLMVSY